MVEVPHGRHARGGEYYRPDRHTHREMGSYWVEFAQQRDNWKATESEYVGLVYDFLVPRHPLIPEGEKILNPEGPPYPGSGSGGQLLMAGRASNLTLL